MYGIGVKSRISPVSHHPLAQSLFRPLERTALHDENAAARFSTHQCAATVAPGGMTGNVVSGRARNIAVEIRPERFNYLKFIGFRYN